MPNQPHVAAQYDRVVVTAENSCFSSRLPESMPLELQQRSTMNHDEYRQHVSTINAILGKTNPVTYVLGALAVAALIIGVIVWVTWPEYVAPNNEPDDSFFGPGRDFFARSSHDFGKMIALSVGLSFCCWLSICAFCVNAYRADRIKKGQIYCDSVQMEGGRWLLQTSSSWGTRFFLVLEFQKKSVE